MRTSSKPSEVIRFRAAVTVAAILLTGHLALVIWLRNSPPLSLALNDVFLPVINGLAVGCLFYAAQRSAGHERVAWTVLAVAQLFDTLGDVLYAIVEIGLHQPGFSSVADGPYLISYLLFAIGILLLPGPSLSSRERLRLLLNMSIAMIASALASWAILIAPTLATNATDRVVQAIAMAYIASTFVLLLALLNLLFNRIGGAGQGPLILLAASAAVKILAGAVSILLSSEAGIYASGGLVDTLWVASYVLIGLAGLLHARPRPVDLSPHDTRGPEWEQQQSVWSLYLPYLWVAAACALLVWNHYRSLAMPTDVLMWGVVAIVGLVIVHQILVLQENTQLYRAARQEIAERKRAEQSLRLLEKALETMNLGVTISNPDGIIIYANPAEAQMHGYTVQELMGLPSKTLAPPDQWRPSGIEERTKSWTSWQRESVNVRKDASIFPVQLFSDVVKDANGELVGLVTSCLDITERKRAEEALRRAHDELELRVKERTAELVQANQELQEEIAERKQVEAALRESEERYRSHFESVNEVIYSIDPELRILNVSPSVERHLGYKPEELIGRRADELNLLASNCVEAALSDMLRVLSGERIDSAVYEFIAKDGTRKLSEVSGGPLFREGRVVALVSVARDITDRHRAEEESLQRAAQLEALRQVGLEITAQLDSDHLLHSIAAWAAELLQSASGGIYLYRPERDLLEWAMPIGPDQPPVGVILRWGEGLSGKIWQTGAPLIVDDYQRWEGRASIYASYPWTAAVGVPIRWGDEFLGVLVVNTVAQRTFSQADAELLGLFATQAAIAIRNARLFSALSEERARLELLSRLGQHLSTSLDVHAVAQRALDDICAIVGAMQGVVFVAGSPKEGGDESLRLAAISGYNIESMQALDRQLDLRVGMGLVGWVAMHRQSALVEDVRQDSRWIVLPGVDEWARSVLDVPLISRDELVGVLSLTSGQVSFFQEEHRQLTESVAAVVAVALANARLYERAQHEIADRKRAEERLQISLREKEVLLKEIHHRVKNNLQVVSSLLSLQALRVQDATSPEVLRESQNRIKSMALIHEELYQSQDLAWVDFGEYVRHLTTHLFRAYQVHPGLIALYVSVSEDIKLGIDTAIPCGLIVNELVSNAFKHAFAGGRSGEVRVDLERSSSRQLILWVSDNGSGFPAEVDYRNTESLGLQLVTTLVDQLAGTIELDREGGTRFKITFMEP